MNLGRTCCCDDYPAGPHCFEISFTPKFLQWRDHAITVDTCTHDFGEPCGSVTVWDITFAVTNNAWAQVTAKPVVMSMEGETGCSCGTVCTYTWTPPATSWTAAARWCSLDCALGTSNGHYRIVSGTNLVSVAGAPTPPCSLVDGGGLVLTFRGFMPEATLTGACGDLEILNGFGHDENVTTDVQLVYCARVGTSGCVLDLYSVSVGATALTFGAPPARPECYCDDTGPSTTYSGSVPAATEYAGSLGSIYALAGSPPLVITCGPCA